MNKKKGISAVVATVLIILITVAAVTIIWAAIIPMIKDQLQESTVCLDASSSLAIENKGFTCFNAGTDVNVQVSHGSKDVGLINMQILITDDTGNTVSYEFADTEVTGNLPTPNGESVLTIAHTGIAQSVSVAPIVAVGNSETICSASISVALEAC